MYCINKLYNESQGDVNDEFENSEGKGGQGLGSIVSQSKDLVGAWSDPTWEFTNIRVPELYQNWRKHTTEEWKYTNSHPSIGT